MDCSVVRSYRYSSQPKPTMSHKGRFHDLALTKLGSFQRKVGIALEGLSLHLDLRRKGLFP